ncbi:histidine phosphatase family protein [Sporolactobacillus nakayamae]|uniref:Probable phosphoglycerate mutase n=1 Tax=Sporolactobacillus nakayamae TaxID=269670 RepID=A0A1I2QYW7_9BACL|nr:histidine phosphatase family protein [Sporolactobacillus nakayamae]SFG32459.1 probable phosphoglycerate mutase [Sporolactobacillus nakayamae]
MKRIYLVRHGETFFNLLNIAQGCADSPLTIKGEEEARSLGKALKQNNITINTVYTSDLTRAKHTAKLILKGSDLSMSMLSEIEELREVSFGSFEGMNSHLMWNKSGTAVNLPQFNSDYPDWQKILVLEGLKKRDTFHAAENYSDVKKRIHRLLEIFTSAPSNDILAVSHGLFISCLVFFLSNEQIKVDVIPNASLTKIVYDGKDFNIDYVGKSF